MGVVATPTPFRIFSRAVFAFLLGLSFGQLPTLCPNIHVLMKKNIKNFAVKIVGVWRFQQPTPPEREGVAAKINTISLFLFFPFCHNNDYMYVPEILET